jgi:hypothetical protein
MRMTLEGRGYVSDNYSCVSYQVVELKFKKLSARIQYHSQGRTRTFLLFELFVLQKFIKPSYIIYWNIN